MAEAPPEFTPRQKYEAADREVKFRKRVFARKVAEGKMTPNEARYQTRVMEAIRDDYKDRDLFG